MKISKVLIEQDGQIMIYHAEYSYKDGGLGRFNGESFEGSFEDAVGEAQDGYGIDGKELYPGVWVGWKFEDPDISDESDEDGSYQYQEMLGNAIIVVQGEMQGNHPLFRKMKKEMDADGDNKMSDHMYEYNDEKEYARDKHAYYGVKKSDF